MGLLVVCSRRAQLGQGPFTHLSWKRGSSYYWVRHPVPWPGCDSRLPCATFRVGLLFLSTMLCFRIYDQLAAEFRFPVWTLAWFRSHGESTKTQRALDRKAVIV